MSLLMFLFIYTVFGIVAAVLFASTEDTIKVKDISLLFWAVILWPIFVWCVLAEWAKKNEDVVLWRKKK